MHMLDKHASPGPVVVKYGGNALPLNGTADPILAEVASLWKSGIKVVLVHGGGPEIDAWLSARNVTTQRIDGLRVTDQTTLEITEAVLCGTLNKRLVRNLSALGVQAVGVSGQDASTLTATRASNPSLGFVGLDVACRAGLLQHLLATGYLPVIAPLAVTAGSETALNVNADSAAAAIASALRAAAFVLLTNVNRVLRDPTDFTSAIHSIEAVEARAFAASPGCSGGMKPKIEAAIDAVERGAAAAYICGVKPGAIASALRGDATVVTSLCRTC